jgi:hypothetical protein
MLIADRCILDTGFSYRGHVARSVIAVENALSIFANRSAAFTMQQVQRKSISSEETSPHHCVAGSI